MQEPNSKEPAPLKRDIGFFDLMLFYIVSGLSIRWIATAAASGPSSIVIWIFACCGFFLPLAACVLELSSRYPKEGGLYVWTQTAFGDFAGFIASWTYGMSNLPYFPAVLYFGAGTALFAAGKHAGALANSRAYYLIFILGWLAIITLLNMVGLNVGKWISNLGAFGSWVPIAILIVLGAVSAWHFGSATHFTLAAITPHPSLTNAVFWSTMFFAFGGCEAGSFMGEEIRNARVIIPRALIISGAVLVFGYIAGTLSMLVALPMERISDVGGFVTAMQLMCDRLGIGWLAIVVAILVVVAMIGSAAAYLSSTSRLPFVAGVDHYLPAAFGRIHPRWRTPYIAIGLYGLAGMLFAVLSQAGTTVKGAYDILVSMSIITYFIPYLFIFASMILLQREPAAPGVIRVPGGKWVAIPIACVGLLTTLLTIVLSVVPAADEPHKTLAVCKVLGATIVLVGGGVLVFVIGRVRQLRAVVRYR
jgi:amino acid transporter